jgi:CBS domain-containing protein
VSAIEAMLLMNEHQIGAVAVVDGVGKIIGNFSVSEMRCAGGGGSEPRRGRMWGLL